MKIAIVGTGISGLGAAWLLNASRRDITVYEKNAYIGGHSRTIDIQMGNDIVPVDTGFIVFNNWNYPNLMGLFKELGVPYEKSDMSFGVSIDDGWLEYSSGHMFAAKNMSRQAYWGMLKDILCFNRQAVQYIEKSVDITLGECLDELKMGNWFRQYYLLGMGAAIWSCPVETILTFPARTFLQFFRNHGLLNIHRRPQWYTVTGGSREYVQRLRESFKDRIRSYCGVENVFHEYGKWHVLDSQGQCDSFDQVIFACHADEVLKILEEPDADVLSVLGDFSYQKNRIIVHGDTDFMPKNKKCWASWVYLSEAKKEDKPSAVSLSYWMNNLQSLGTDVPVMVTLNPQRQPREDLIYDEHTFSHPVFDLKAIRAQDAMSRIQGKNGLWFCGAYQRYGFHEDGLLSAVKVALQLGASIPWK